MPHSICVFCSSSDRVAPVFFDAARELGAEIARRGHTLVYGGAGVGLMGTVARSVHQHGGRVVGVIPEALKAAGIGYDLCDELIVTRDMRERKAVLDQRSTAFFGLPGGFGTLEEVLEAITLKQLSYHAKPVLLLNLDGFYNPLEHLFEHIYAQNFAREHYRELYHFAPAVSEAFTYLDAYQPPTVRGKWS